MFDLSKSTIGIKTILRDAKLFYALDGIRKTMPEVKIVVADDGIMTEEKDGVYADLVREGHKIIVMDFDSGFGAKSNKIAEELDTPYLLTGSDNFDFNPTNVRQGIEKLVSVIEQCPERSIVSGRVNNKPYEFFLLDGGDVIAERY